MKFTEEWKSLWPISSTFSAPLFIASKGSKGSDAPFGPLIFTPNPNSSTTLLRSPSITPRLPPPHPELSLSRFLRNCHSVPSPATSISSLLGPELPNLHLHGFNTLQLLQIPDKNLIILFFLVGENSDRVGFTLISVKDGNLNVYSEKEDFFQLVKEGNVNRHRITHLVVNPIDDYFCCENEDAILRDSHSGKRHNDAVTVGYLMACSNYSVDWYRIGIKKDHRQNGYCVFLDYLGCAEAKMLRGNEVVGTCWSPHLRKECLVLLENGDLLLFDVDYSSKRKDKSMFLVNSVVGKRMKVSLNDKVGLEEEDGDKGLQWFGCEFSWHPRIFVVCHHKEVFLVDSRSAGECSVGSLLKLEMLSTFKHDGFLTLSGVRACRFSFVVATRNLLLLCDVRKPLMPVLRWTHGIRNPRYVTVFGLPELRANAKDTKYNLASESGYCIMLGSFWDNEFKLFCCGPDVKRNTSVYSEISKFCNSYYAWGHPSNFSMSDSDCKCGSCVTSQEFSKESHLVWIDWRQKKHLTLGFGILHPALFAQLTPPDHFGGFILIKLTSSGKIETQSYVAAWESEAISLIGHKRKGVYSQDNFLYDRIPSEYDGKKKFQHLKLEYLNSYLKDKLAKVIVRRRENREEGNQGAQVKRVVKLESSFHREICHKLKYFGLSRVESSSHAISDVMKTISLPTGVQEIALRSMYAILPINLLQLAFSTYADFNGNPEHCKEALEFLGIPNKFQHLPCPLREPSNRCNKWSRKTYPLDDTLVGPIIPPQFLVTLHKIHTEELKVGTEPYLEESESFSALSHLKLQCDKILDVAQEHVSISDVKAQDEDFVSLADDKDDMGCTTPKLKLSYHKPSSFLENPSSVGSLKGKHHEYFTHIFRRNQEFTSDISAEMAGIELFNVGCPVELKFDDCCFDFSPKELEAFKSLKNRELKFQKGFKPYQDYIKTEMVELKKD